MSTRSKKLMWPKPTQYWARRLWEMRRSCDLMYLSGEPRSLGACPEARSIGACPVRLCNRASRERAYRCGIQLGQRVPCSPPPARPANGGSCNDGDKASVTKVVGHKGVLAPRHIWVAGELDGLQPTSEDPCVLLPLFELRRGFVRLLFQNGRRRHAGLVVGLVDEQEFAPVPAVIAHPDAAPRLVRRRGYTASGRAWRTSSSLRPCAEGWAAQTCCG